MSWSVLGSGWAAVLLATATAAASPATDGGAPQLSLLAPVGPGSGGGPQRYDLRPAKDGTGDFLYEGRAFAARVAADGTVTFSDHHVRDVGYLPPWLPVPVNNGVPSLQSTLSSVLRRRKPPAVETVAPPDDSFLIIPNVTPYRPDPREACRTCDNFHLSPMLLNASGKADLTDFVTRFSGHDPNRLEKARFLAATWELRLGMAVAAHAERIRRASAELPARLEAIACGEGLSLAERRAVLEALRAEMDATPAGRDAAAKIASFLAARFSGPDAPGACPAKLPTP
jgi:hypothetical protein